jgi:hypothetical protein
MRRAGSVISMSKDRSIYPFRDPRPHVPPPRTCDHCGATGLVWAKFKGEYRLTDGLGPHVCEPDVSGFGSLEA